MNSRWFVSIAEIKMRVTGTVVALIQAPSERRRVWLGPRHAGSEHPKPPENFDIIKLPLDPVADSPALAYHIARLEEDDRWGRWKQRIIASGIVCACASTCPQVQMMGVGLRSPLTGFPVPDGKANRLEELDPSRFFK